MNVNKLNTKISHTSKGSTLIPPKKICRPHLPSPKTLIELCGDVLDAAPMPRCWNWTVDEVIAWLPTIGLPQYQEIFKVNKIDGRKLMLVDAVALIRMNAYDFDEIKKLTAGIRKLGGLQREKTCYSRRISLPPFEAETFYILYSVHHNIKRLEFFIKALLVHKPAPPRDHWDSIEPCPPEYPPDKHRVYLPDRKYKNDWSRKQTKCVHVEKEKM